VNPSHFQGRLLIVAEPTVRQPDAGPLLALTLAIAHERRTVGLAGIFARLGTAAVPIPVVPCSNVPSIYYWCRYSSFKDLDSAIAMDNFHTSISACSEYTTAIMTATTPTRPTTEAM
jgi:hypothetical protein